MSILHSYLSDVKIAQEQIRERLNALLLAPADAKQFFSYCTTHIHPNYFEPVERILFSAIHNNPKIRSGGPMCMLYFDQHMSQNPLDRAAKVCGTKRLRPDSTNSSEHTREFYESGSPVCIPLEDHLACRQIFSYAEAILGTQPQNSTSPELLQLMNTYQDILKKNFDKVSNCLLPMCQSILSTQELDDCAARLERSRGL